MRLIHTYNAFDENPPVRWVRQRTQQAGDTNQRRLSGWECSISDVPMIAIPTSTPGRTFEIPGKLRLQTAAVSTGREALMRAWMPESIPAAWIIDDAEVPMGNEAEPMPLEVPLGWGQMPPAGPPTPVEKPLGSTVVVFDI